MTETVLRQLTIGKTNIKVAQRQTGFAVILPIVETNCPDRKTANKVYREIVRNLIHKVRESTQFPNVDTNNEQR